MLTVDLASAVPIVDQIARGLRRKIALGEVRPGDELPPVRQLAGDLGINLNTVARAYRLLEADGLLVTARGRGTRVTGEREIPRGTAVRVEERVHDGLLDALCDARLAGMPMNAVSRILDDLVARLWLRLADAEGRGP